jgi:hypothetical protein
MQPYITPRCKPASRRDVRQHFTSLKKKEKTRERKERLQTGSKRKRKRSVTLSNSNNRGKDQTNYRIYRPVLFIDRTGSTKA